MNNKKLSRLLEPNLKLYFFCMIIFAAAACTVSLPLGLVELACAAALYAYSTKRNQMRRRTSCSISTPSPVSVDTASKSTLINSPLPIMVFRPDTGEVIWSNENFLQLAGVREHLFEMKVEDAVTDFPVQWLLEGKSECPDRVVMNSRRFRVYGSLVRAKGRSGEQNLVATTYWGGHHRGRRAEGALHRHPSRAGPCDGGQLRGSDEGLRRHGPQRRAGPDRREAEPVGRLRGRAAAQDPSGTATSSSSRGATTTTSRRSGSPSWTPSGTSGWGTPAPPSPSASARTPTPWRSCTGMPSCPLEMAQSRGAATRAVVRGKVGFEFFGRAQQVHGEAHQGEVPGHGQRPQRAGGRRGGDLHHGPQLCRHGRRGRRGGPFAASPASGANGPRWSSTWSATPPARSSPSSGTCRNTRGCSPPGPMRWCGCSPAPW